MESDLIVTRLYDITTSRLFSISKLYGVDCNTSNVTRLHKALKKALDSKRIEVKVTVEVDHDEVVDMVKSLEEAIKHYKLKYNRSTFPKEINLYQIIDDFKKLNPTQIVTAVLKDRDSKEDKKRVSGVSKKKKIEDDYENFLMKRKLELM